VVISVLDCAIAEAALFAMENEPPEEEETPAVAVPATEAFPGPLALAETSAEAEIPVENDLVADLLTEVSFALVKPVSIATEAPCVLLATRRQKPLMVLSGCVDGGKSFLTSGEST